MTAAAAELPEAITLAPGYTVTCKNAAGEVKTLTIKLTRAQRLDIHLNWHARSCVRNSYLLATAEREAGPGWTAQVETIRPINLHVVA